MLLILSVVPAIMAYKNLDPFETISCVIKQLCIFMFDWCAKLSLSSDVNSAQQ